MLKGRKGLVSLFAAIFVASIVAAPGQARADDCSIDGFRVGFTPESGLSTVHRNGDQLEIGAVVSNDATGTCPMTGTRVSIHPPAPDGSEGDAVIVAEQADFPSGMGPTPLFPTVPYTVDLAEGVFTAPVAVRHRGTSQIPSGPRPSAGSLSALVAISRPVAAVTVTPDVASGPPPLAVTYSYSVRNVSPTPPSEPDIGPAPGLLPIDPGPESRLILADDLCGTPEYVSGDVNPSDPAVLDPGPTPEAGEEWRFTCTHTFERPGTYDSKVEVAGVSTRDGRPWPGSTAEATVTVTGPDLVVEKTHRGNFLAGGTGEYTITVTNRGTTATTAPVDVTDVVPAGLTVTAISGEGWSCSTATARCTRSDALPAGNSYPPVTLTVRVAGDAPSLVTNVARVGGGGQVGVVTDNDSASDPTVVRSPASPMRNAGPGFRILRVKAGRHGTTVVRLRATRRGTLRVLDGRRPKRIKSLRRRFTRPRAVNLRIRPTRALRKQLRHRRAAGKRKPIRVRATFRFRQANGAIARRHHILPFRLR